MTETKTPPRAANKDAAIGRKPVAARPAQPDDFSDVMEALAKVNANNDELAIRIDRLVSSLQ